MVCLKQGRWGRTRDLLLLSQTDMEQFTILLNLTTANLSDALSLFQSIGGSKKGVSVNHSKKKFLQPKHQHDFFPIIEKPAKADSLVCRFLIDPTSLTS